MDNKNFLSHSIIAHRGIYNNITIFENTLESVMYAVKNNLSIEIDVRFTSDEEIIVFHDDDGSRMLKLKDNINSLTKEDIDYLSNYHIPTLEEILNIVNGKVPIIIEVKEDNKKFRKKLINILKRYNGDFAIESFIYDAVKYYKKKKYIVGLLVGMKKNRGLLNKRLDLDFIAIKYNSLDRREINSLKSKYYLIGWTVDNRSDAEEYIRLYNNLIIDNIEEVFK